MASPPWWQRGTIYQVYPRSFADGDGDGVGDLPGLRGRLDHLSALHVEAVWLSPVFPSPMADFGYDVADYCDVDPLFGTLADLDTLIADCHERGIRVVLDWVPNHSSDRHPWFLASRSSRDDPKRDWYVWRDGSADGGPPNDWQAEVAPGGPGRAFGGTAARPPTGRPSSPPSARPGPSTRRRASGTCTPSRPSSPTSTGTTPRSRRRCTTFSVSGSTAVWTDCGSTPSSAWPTIRCCAATPAPTAATIRTGRPRTSACAGSGGWSTSTRTG